MHLAQLGRSFIGACLVVLMLAGAADAIIIHDSPIFGVVNGTQTARINAVLQSPPEPDLPCPVTLRFLDSQGNQIGDPGIFELRGGVAAATDFRSGTPTPSPPARAACSRASRLSTGSPEPRTSS